MSSASVASGFRRETELALMWVGGGLLLVVLWINAELRVRANLLCAWFFLFLSCCSLCTTKSQPSSGPWFTWFSLGIYEGLLRRLGSPRRSILASGSSGSSNLRCWWSSVT